MHAAMLLLSLAVAGNPAHSDRTCRHGRPAGHSIGQRLADHTTYCRRADHGASYRQWPHYDAWLEFDYPWYGPWRPPWFGTHAIPEPGESHAAPAVIIECLPPPGVPLGRSSSTAPRPTSRGRSVARFR